MSRALLPVRAFALIVALIASDAAAEGRVRCPVCGQLFDGETEVCPDDGTDLALEGVPVAGEAEDEAAEDGAAPARAADEEAGDLPAPKYKRHDSGGDRQRGDAEDGGGYSDRRGRIGEERRGAEVRSERQQRTRDRRRREQRFAETDRRLRAEFEQRRRARDSGEAAGPAHGRASRFRAAPVTAVGLRLAWMGERGSPGPLLGGELDLNYGRSFFRVGLSGLLAVRNLPGRDDLVFLQQLTAGVQLPGRFTPYAQLRGGLGALLRQEVGADDTGLLGAIGFDSGLDCWLTRSVVLTPSIGYVRYMVKGASWDSFTARLAVGF